MSDRDRFDQEEGRDAASLSAGGRRSPGGARNAPGIHDAFQQFSRHVFADDVLDKKTKHLIDVAVAHVTRSKRHTEAAPLKGAGEPELVEAIWVAAEMRAGGAYAHSIPALDTAGYHHGSRAA